MGTFVAPPLLRAVAWTMACVILMLNVILLYQTMT
jgi:Mn2+/Fe2+ NRAMP family transporter